MRATLQNTGQTISLAIFFTIVLEELAGSLPHALSAAVVSAGAPTTLAYLFSKIPPTGALFAAFLGYNPVSSILSQLPASQVSQLSSTTLATLTGTHWFPTVIAGPFMSALGASFYIGAGISLVAAVSSALRGRVYIYDTEKEITAQANPPNVKMPQVTRAGDSAKERKQVSGGGDS